MKAKVLVSLYGGLFETGPRVFTDDAKAEEAWKLQRSVYGIVEGKESESENEVHLFEDVEIEGAEDEKLCTQRNVKLGAHDYFVTYLPTATSGLWFTIHDEPHLEVWAAVAIEPDGEVVGWRNPLTNASDRAEMEMAIKAAFPEYFDPEPETVLSPEQKADYLASGGQHCPFCKSEDIAGTDLDYGQELLQKCECMDCGKHWTDVYRLVAVEPREDA